MKIEPKDLFVVKGNNFNKFFYIKSNTEDYGEAHIGDVLLIVEKASEQPSGFEAWYVMNLNKNFYGYTYKANIASMCKKV